MDSGIKERLEAVKFYLIIFACAFVVAVYTSKPLEEPKFITNEAGKIVSCSICNPASSNTQGALGNDTTKSLVPEIAKSNQEISMNVDGMESSVHLSVPGKVMTIDENHIKNAIVEHVELYPKEHAQSDKTITRNGMLVRYHGVQKQRC